MICTLRIFLDGRERFRRDNVSNLHDPTFQYALKEKIEELHLLHSKVAVTVIAGGAEHVIYSGRSA